MNKLSIPGLAIGLAATFGVTVVSVGLLAHFTSIGSSFIGIIDQIYPGIGTGPRGILVMLIFTIIHGLASGALIAFFYNSYVTSCTKKT